MRIGIISDTHDEFDRTRTAVEMLRAEGASAIFHCGDLASPPILRICGLLPCYFTFGNHDADSVPDLNRAADEIAAVCLGWGGVVELAGKRVGVAHGHMTTDIQRVLGAKPDYLLSGHSHICGDAQIGPVRRINPGALFEADELTVAVLDLISDELRFLHVPE